MKGLSAVASPGPRSRFLLAVAFSLSGCLTTSFLAADTPPAGAGRGLHAHIVLDSGQVVAEHNADVLLEPASVLKLVVAAVALEVLGPEYRVETRASAGAAPDAQGVIGDLVIHGAGDPTWNRRFFPPDRRDPSDSVSGAGSHPVDQLVEALWARGVRRVAGDLVLDVGAFPPPQQPRSRPLAELALGWAAPVAALAVDENALRVHIAPGSRVGAPATARVLTVDRGLPRPGALGAGASADGVTSAGAPDLEVTAYTVSAQRHNHGTVSFLPVFGRNALRIEGEYPVSEPAYDVSVAMPDPVRAVASALRTACARRGLRIEGRDQIARVGRDPVVVLATVRSPPLSDWLRPVLELSHNWYAEMLLRQIAVAHTGTGRLEDGLAGTASVLTEKVGVAGDAFSLDDGSGLSADNLITVRAVAEVLAWAWHRPWRDHLVGALARPGKGTLRSWNGLPRLAAKTGSKQHVQALAGYLHPDSGRPLVFAIVLDHRTDAVSARRAEITRWLNRL